MSVYVVLVNYNGWRDTIECLESLFASDCRDFCVLVCDNGSQDGSLDHLERWAGGAQEPSVAESRPAGLPAATRLAKPLGCLRLERAEAEAGCDPGGARLVLIDCGTNLGFAGGNNVGLRYALSRGDLEFAWLLNNDTVVAPGAMSALAARLGEDHRVGLCGSTLLFYHRPDRIQALGGGWYCKWLGLAWHLGMLRHWRGFADRDRVERCMHYPVGASIMVSRAFLDQVGLLSEEYFLYFEELDWVLRASGRFSVAYAPGSIVYHKVGGSLGTSSNPAKKSAACDYWSARNRLFFTRRWFPEAFWSVYLGLIGTLLVRLFLGRWNRVVMLWRLLSGGWKDRLR
jgi:GT2 family glycosyltransferase